MKKIIRKLIKQVPPSLQIRLKREVTLLYDKAGYGDTLMVAAVAREIKKKYKGVRVLVNRTKKELLKHNPYIDNIGNQYNGIDLNYHYGRFNAGKDFHNNLIGVMCRKVGIKNPDNSVNIFFTDKENHYADIHTKKINKPLITIHTTSGSYDNGRKLWPHRNWLKLVKTLGKDFTLMQLGHSQETPIGGTLNYLGKQNIRLSIALIKKAEMHIGIVSSLMHGAAAVNTPAIILFGGFESYQAHGYKNIFPIESTISCSPCIRANKIIPLCPIQNQCMYEITPDMIIRKVMVLHQKLKS